MMDSEEEEVIKTERKILAKFVSKYVTPTVPDTVICYQIAQRVSPSIQQGERLKFLAELLKTNVGITKEVIVDLYRFSSVIAKTCMDQFKLLVEFLNPTTYFLHDPDAKSCLQVELKDGERVVEALKFLFKELASSYYTSVDTGTGSDGLHNHFCDNTSYAVDDLFARFSEYGESGKIKWTPFIQHLESRVKDEWQNRMTICVFSTTLKLRVATVSQDENVSNILHEMYKKALCDIDKDVGDVFFLASSLSCLGHKGLLTDSADKIITTIKDHIEDTQMVIDLCSCLDLLTPLSSGCLTLLQALITNVNRQVSMAKIPKPGKVLVYKVLNKALKENEHIDHVDAKLSGVIVKDCSKLEKAADVQQVFGSYEVGQLARADGTDQLGMQDKIDTAVLFLLEDAAQYGFRSGPVRNLLHLVHLAFIVKQSVKTWKYADNFGALLVDKHNASPVYKQAWDCFLQLLQLEEQIGRDEIDNLVKDLANKIEAYAFAYTLDYINAILPAVQALYFMSTKFGTGVLSQKYEEAMTVLAERNPKHKGSSMFDQEYVKLLEEIRRQTLLPALDKKMSMGFVDLDDKCRQDVYGLLLFLLKSHSQRSGVLDECMPAQVDDAPCITNLLVIGGNEQLLKGTEPSEQADDSSDADIDMTALDIIISHITLPQFKQLLLDHVDSDKLTMAMRSFFGDIFKYTEILPVNIAALTSGLEGVKRILDKTGDISGTDSKGTVLHTLTLMHRSNPERAMEIFQFLQKNVDMHSHIRKMMFEVDVYVMSPLEKIIMRDGGELLEAMLQFFCKEEFRFSGGIRKLYDAPMLDTVYTSHCASRSETDLTLTSGVELHTRHGSYDTMPNSNPESDGFPEKKHNPSLFDLAIHYNRDKINCLEKDPMKTLLAKKTSAYLPVYMGLGLLHLVFMILFTAFMLPDPLRTPFAYGSVESVVNQSLSKNVASANDIKDFECGMVFRDIFVIFLMMYAMLIMVSDLWDTVEHTILNEKNVHLLRRVFVCKDKSTIFYGRLRKAWKFWTLYFTNFRLLILAFSMFVFAYVVSISSGGEYARIWLASSMILGWTCMLFFSTGNHMSVMLFRMASIVMSFVMVFFCFLFGYSCAMYTIFKGTEGASEGFSSFTYTLFTMFSVMAAVTEIEVLDQSAHPTFAYTIYVAYILTATILLLNMLIAVMSDVQAQLSSKRVTLWNQEVAMIVQLLERRLPVRFHRKSYLDKIDGQLYLSCVETEVSVSETHTVRQAVTEQFLPGGNFPGGTLTGRSRKEAKREHILTKEDEPLPELANPWDIHPYMTSWEKRIHIGPEPVEVVVEDDRYDNGIFDRNTVINTRHANADAYRAYQSLPIQSRVSQMGRVDSVRSLDDLDEGDD